MSVPLFLIGSSTITLDSSNDAVSWSTSNLPSSNFAQTIWYVNETYYIGSVSTVKASTDLVNWTTVLTIPQTGGHNNFVWAGAYLNGLHVVAGGNDFANGLVVYTSSNGTSWTSQTTNTTVGAYGTGVCYALGKYFVCAVNDLSSLQPDIISSSNGSTWSEVYVGSISTNLLGIAGSATEVISILDGGSSPILRSTNGTSWTPIATTGSLHDIAYGNETYVIVGGDGVILTSTDNGVTWNFQTNPLGSVNMTAVGYGNGLWISVDSGGHIITSTNATSWTQRTSNTTANLVSIGFGTPHITQSDSTTVSDVLTNITLNPKLISANDSTAVTDAQTILIPQLYLSVSDSTAITDQSGCSYSATNQVVVSSSTFSNGSTISFSNNVTKGNTIIVYAPWNSNTPGLTSVTDSLFNNYSFVGSLPSTNGYYFNVLIAPVTTSGSCTITLHATNGTGYGLAIVEVLGAATFDQQNVNYTAATPITTGSITPTKTKEYVGAFFWSASGSMVSSSLITEAISGGSLYADTVQGVTSPVNANANYSSGSAYGYIASFTLAPTLQITKSESTVTSDIVSVAPIILPVNVTSDSTAVSDYTSGSIPFPITGIYDSTAISEYFVVSIPISISKFDSTAVSENVSAQSPAPNVFDSTTTTDVNTVSIAGPAISAFESTAITDSTTQNITTKIITSDSTAVTDIPQFPFIVFKVADSTVTTDISQENFPLAVSVFDSTTTTDSYVNLPLSLSVFESTQIQDVANKMGQIVESVITFVAAGTSAYDANSNNLTPGLPSGWQAGDLHFIVIAETPTWGANPTISGFNIIFRSSSGGSPNVSLIVYYRYAVAGDTAPTITASGSGGDWTAQIVGYRNINTNIVLNNGTPTHGTEVDQTGTTNVQGNSLTATVNFAKMIFIGCTSVSASFTTSLPYEFVTNLTKPAASLFVADNATIFNNGVSSGTANATASQTGSTVGGVFQLFPVPLIQVTDSTSITDTTTISVSSPTINVSESTAITDAFNPIQFRSTASTTQQNIGNVTAYPYPYSVTGGTGSLLVVAATWESDAVDTITGAITDSVGNIYTKVFPSDIIFSYNTYNFAWNLFFAVDVTGWQTPNTTNIILTLSGVPADPFSNVPVSSISTSYIDNFINTPLLDVNAFIQQQTNTTGIITGDTQTTNFSNEVILAYIINQIVSFGSNIVPVLTAASPWVGMGSPSSAQLVGEYQVGVPINTYSPSWIASGHPSVLSTATISFVAKQFPSSDTTIISDVITLNIPVQFAVGDSTDTTTVSDSVFVETIDLLSVFDSTAATDTATVDIPLTVNVFDSSVIGEFVFVSSISIFEFESTTVSDVVTLVLNLFSVEDSSSITDSCVVDVPITFSVNDQSVIIDSIIEDIPLTFSVNDSIPTTDVQFTEFVFDSSATDITSITDQATASLQSNTIAADYTVVFDSPVTNISVSISVYDSTTTTDVLAVDLTYDVSVQESTAVTDQLKNNIAVNVKASDIASPIDFTVPLLLPLLISDLTAVSDTPTMELFLNVTASDSTAVTDSTTETVTFYTAAEIITASDVPNFSFTFYINIAESTTTSDYPTINIPLYFSVFGDTATTSDTAKCDIPLPIFVSDSTAVSDTAISFIPILTIIVQDMTAVSDTITMAGVLNVSVSESTAVSDTTTESLTSNVFAAESTSTSDSVLVSIQVAVAVSDATTVTDSPANSIPVAVVASDSSAIQESAGVFVPPLAPFNYDSTAVSDTVSLNVPVNIFVLDFTTVSDSVAQNIPVNLSVSDSTVTTDQVFANSLEFIFTSDSTVVSDTIVANIPVSISVSDSTAVSDSVSSYIFVSVVASDSTAIQEATSFTGTAQFSTSDSTVTSDVISLNFILPVFASDSTAASEYWTVNIPVTISQSEVVTISDFTNEHVDAFLSVFDLAVVADPTNERVSDLFPIVAETSVILDVPVLNVSVGVFTSDTSSVTDAVQNNIAFGVVASDSTTIMEVVGAAYPLQISVVDQTTINESVVAAEFAWIYVPNVSDTTKVNEHVQILKSNTPGRAATTDKLVNRTKIVVQPQANPPAGFEG